MKIRRDLIIAVVGTFCVTVSLFGARAMIDMGRFDFVGGGPVSTSASDGSVWRCARSSVWIASASFEQWNFDYFGDYFWGGGCLNEGAFYAQIQLPDGVIVKNMTVLGTKGNNGTVAMEVSLYAVNMSEFDPDALYISRLMAQAGNWYRVPAPILVGFDDTIDYDKIDTEHCIYCVYVRMYQFAIQQESLNSVRIDYEHSY